jgi:L-iditol 2-dehydrogenase
MRIARVMAPRELRLEEAPVPVPGPGEALVRIKAVGVCGSDLQYYAQGRIGELQFTAGHILGHEVAGVVEALGPGVEGPAPGTRVAVDPAINCGRCCYCAEGNPNFCTHLRFFGSPPTAGALQELIAHPNHLLLPLAPDTALSVGAVVEPLGVALHAVDLGHLRLGARVAIFGCGPIGILTARVARLAGATQVVAVEPLAHRRKAALDYGATAAFSPEVDDVVRAIHEATEGRGVDVAFEMAGSQAATDQALDVLRPGGTAVLVGYWKAERVTVMGIRAMRKGLTLRFVRRMKNTFERAIDLTERGLVDLKGLITHEFPLDEVAAAFARAEKRGPDILKAVITL